MAFTRIKVDSDGRSSLFYKPPGETPPLVWVARGLVILLLLQALFSMMKLRSFFSDVRDQISMAQSQLYQQSTWDQDMSIDGRFRYCRENPDECMSPWGGTSMNECVDCLSGGEIEDVSELMDLVSEGFDEARQSPLNSAEALMSIQYMMGELAPDCGCRDLFTPYGWGGPERPWEETIVGQVVPFADVVDCDRADGCQELTMNVATICRGGGGRARDENGNRVRIECEEYPLYGDFTDGFVPFMGKEVLKVLNTTVRLVRGILIAVLLFLIVRWLLVLKALMEGKPRAHQQLIRTGAIQIGVAFAQMYLIGKITAVAYPFAGFGGGFSFFTVLLAGAAIGVAMIPDVRRYFSYHDYVRDASSGDTGGGGVTPPPSGPSGPSGGGGFTVPEGGQTTSGGWSSPAQTAPTPQGAPAPAPPAQAPPAQASPAQAAPTQAQAAKPSRRKLGLPGSVQVSGSQSNTPSPGSGEGTDSGS